MRSTTLLYRLPCLSLQRDDVPVWQKALCTMHSNGLFYTSFFGPSIGIENQTITGPSESIAGKLLSDSATVASQRRHTQGTYSTSLSSSV